MVGLLQVKLNMQLKIQKFKRERNLFFSLEIKKEVKLKKDVKVLGKDENYGKILK